MQDASSLFNEKGQLKTIAEKGTDMETGTETTKIESENGIPESGNMESTDGVISLGNEVDKVDVEIDDLVKKQILDFLRLDPTHVKRDVFHARLQQVRVGMEYKRDREKARLTNNQQVIQIVKLLATNETERRRYIKASMPGVKLISPPSPPKP